ncbi:MAG: hypothetical protein PHU80_12295, partial [Kiritimatiellae bacterium]|nr:hypothetical protein [Kiritimatiellia bacterium]
MGSRIPSPPNPEFLAVGADRLEYIAQHAEATLPPDESAVIRAAFATVFYFTTVLQQKNITLKRLQKMVFGAPTETTKAVLDSAGHAPTSTPSEDTEQDPASPASPTGEAPPKPRPGHGR